MHRIIIHFHTEYSSCGPHKVYKKAMKSLLPTPAKSHYTFNLRDFSRVVQGCLLLRRESLGGGRGGGGTMTRLFVHEVLRVFYDRLVDAADRAWLYALVAAVVKEHFRESFEQLFDHLKTDEQVRLIWVVGFVVFLCFCCYFEVQGLGWRVKSGSNSCPACPSTV